MKKLILKQGVEEYDKTDLTDFERADVEQIVAFCQEKDYTIDPLTAFNAWSAYSSSLCAGWLALPTEGEELLEFMLPFCQVVKQ